MNIEFNINDYVLAKITETGIKELERQHNELKKKFPESSIGEFKNPTSDEDGYSEWQLHSLMHRFGHLLNLGGSIPFETKIFFKYKDEKSR